MIYHGRQYATADNVFDYFANYQVISESGQCVFSIAHMAFACHIKC